MLKTLSKWGALFFLPVLILLLVPRHLEAAHTFVRFALPTSLGGVAVMGAISTLTDFKIYDEQFFAGVYEGIAENLNVFNEASLGALILSAKAMKGQFERESFMKNLSTIISRRDPSSVAGVADQKLVQGEFVGPKINRQIGPVAGTLDEWKKINENPELMSFYAGKAAAEGKLQDFVHSAINSVAAAIRGQAGLLTTKGAGLTITQNFLVDIQRPFGDKAANISCFVMHSKPYFDLLGDAITQKIFGVANIAIYEGTVATLGKPTIVVDAPALIIAGAPNRYVTLGLVGGAVEIKESEDQTVFSQMVTGLANLVMRMQGEYAFNIRVKGFAYDTTAGVNPTDAAVGTSANWLLQAAQLKNTAGVALTTE